MKAIKEIDVVLLCVIQVGITSKNHKIIQQKKSLIMYWDDQTIKETINNTNKNIGFSNNKQK